MPTYQMMTPQEAILLQIERAVKPLREELQSLRKEVEDLEAKVAKLEEGK